MGIFTSATLEFTWSTLNASTVVSPLKHGNWQIQKFGQKDQLLSMPIG
nr:MAG TPA: hypothetical protein [Caudoviricetes sp.]